MTDQPIIARTSDVELDVEPARMELPRTGIMVRARLPEGYVDNADIVQLDQDSLIRWLQSRGQVNHWAESVVCLLLGHDR